MTELRCISPIDGSVYATRETVDFDAARDRIRAARKAQADWAARPLQ
ncbi:MAG: aldehyde dehydrogenase, partial [Paracoccus sp.]|nr:aldehyde dehydrogenase [Paracoccus sp. (in: a-proteobacteria)]